MIKSLREARIRDGLPRVLASQGWVLAMSEALGVIHKRTLDFADNSQVYTALDDVPEVILDALAINWKIDWYDTDYSIGQKRRVVKTALTVRRLMGTVRAVKLQANAIYPGTALKEWFEYGGTPGCFRVIVALAEQGISFEQYLQLINGVLLCKNVRSHLEGVSFEWEDTGTNRTGAYVTAVQTIEVWPELPVSAELTGIRSDKAGAVAVAVQTVEIWPTLTEQAELAVGVGSDGFVSVQQTVELYPEERMDAKWRT